MIDASTGASYRDVVASERGAPSATTRTTSDTHAKRRTALPPGPRAHRGRRTNVSYAGSRSLAAILARRWITDFVWIWQTRDSVTPRTWPISARVRPS